MYKTCPMVTYSSRSEILKFSCLSLVDLCHTVWDWFVISRKVCSNSQSSVVHPLFGQIRIRALYLKGGILF